MKENIKMFVAYKLVSLAYRIAPMNKDGKQLMNHLVNYWMEVLEENNDL